MGSTGKSSKTLNEVKPVKNISKNPQIFLEISPMQTSKFPADVVSFIYFLQRNTLESNNSSSFLKN